MPRAKKKVEESISENKESLESLESLETTEESLEVKKKLEAHDEVMLNATPVYSNAYTEFESYTLTGKYYVYNPAVMNGRIRITNNDRYCNQTPTSQFVTGFVDVKDLNDEKRI